MANVAFVGQASCVPTPAAHIAGLRFQSCTTPYQTPMLASPSPQSALTSSNSAVITEQSALIRAATAFHTELCRNKVIREPRRCHARTTFLI
jgi:hypothetical protein